MNTLHLGIIASTLLFTLGATARVARDDHQLLSQLTAPQTPPPTQSTTTIPDWSALSQAYDLFGSPQQSPTEDADRHKPLPQTRLKLVLSGTFTHHNSEKASALIGSNPRQTKRYRAGDTLPGGAELTAIHKGFVTLRYNGQEEVLQFVGRKNPTHRTAPSPQTLSHNNQPSNPGKAPDSL